MKKKTLNTLRSLIESQLGVLTDAQTLSLDANLLLSNPSAALAATLSNPSAPLSSLGLSHGSVVFLSYSGVACSFGPPPPHLNPAGSFSRKMTMDDLIAHQIRVNHQESPHCSTAYFVRDAADAFQLYVAESDGGTGDDGARGAAVPQEAKLQIPKACPRSLLPHPRPLYSPGSREVFP